VLENLIEFAKILIYEFLKKKKYRGILKILIGFNGKS
jgi:hypothetical protein